MKRIPEFKTASRHKGGRQRKKKQVYPVKGRSKPRKGRVGGKYSIKVLEPTYLNRPKYYASEVEIPAESKAEALRKADAEYGAHAVVASSVRRVSNAKKSKNPTVKQITKLAEKDDIEIRTTKVEKTDEGASFEYTRVQVVVPDETDIEALSHLVERRTDFALDDLRPGSYYSFWKDKTNLLLTTELWD